MPKALAHAGLALHDVEFYELNQAFSVVSIANTKILGLDPNKVSNKEGLVVGYGMWGGDEGGSRRRARVGTKGREVEVRGTCALQAPALSSLPFLRLACDCWTWTATPPAARETCMLFCAWFNNSRTNSLHLQPHPLPLCRWTCTGAQLQWGTRSV